MSKRSRSAVGMPRKCAIGTVKTTTASGRSRSTSRSRCRRQRGVTTRQIVSRVMRSPSESSGESSSRRRWRSPLSRAASVARPRVRLALEVGRVRRGPPPRRLDRPPAVRRDDELGALVVQRLPELPPGGRAAVAEVEVDRGGDAEELGRTHPPECRRQRLRRRKGQPICSTLRADGSGRCRSTPRLVLVSLAAMVSPTTLTFSIFALVLGDRPLRTGFLFYLGALSATLAVGRRRRVRPRRRRRLARAVEPEDVGVRRSTSPPAPCCSPGSWRGFAGRATRGGRRRWWRR